MRRMPPFIGDDEREAARYGGRAEQDALSRRSGIGSIFHHKKGGPAQDPASQPAQPIQPAQPALIDSRALVQQATLGNPQAMAQLATIKLQLSQRAAKGDQQSAALLQKIQGFEIQAAIAARTPQAPASPAGPGMPGMPPGYGPPPPGDMPPGQGSPDGMLPISPPGDVE